MRDVLITLEDLAALVAFAIASIGLPLGAETARFLISSL